MNKISNFFGDMFMIQAEATLAEKAENQIKFDNFLAQAPKHNILKLIPDCETKIWFGKTKITTGFQQSAYLELFDWLVNQNIIIKQFGFALFFTADFNYNVNPKLIATDTLKNLLKDKDRTELLKCYTIDYTELSKFLKTYVHNALNIVKMFGGKSNSRNRGRNRGRSRKGKVHKSFINGNYLY